MRFYAVIFLLCVIWPTSSVLAQLQVTDDLGTVIQLKKPAQRIVSLAPHITELLFEVGAGAQVVGTVDYSDYPAAAARLARIGSFSKFDYEAIAALQPDLVIAWLSGNPAEQMGALRQLEVPIFFSEPNKLEHIAQTLEKFGVLAGHPQMAAQQAQSFRQRLHELVERYKNRTKVSVFYQVWNQPLMTINGQHIISDVIRLCGGENVFADMSIIAPAVDIESVLEKNPQVIISGVNEQRQGWLQAWKRWSSVDAVSRQHIYAIDPDLITRHTSRILIGARQVCDFIDKARH